LERIPPGHTPKEKPSASAKYVKRNDKWQKGVVSELLWFLGAGGIGWLTGKIVGGRGYGDSFGSHINTGLDVILGIVGGYVGGFVYTWAIPGGGSVLNKFTTAILTSVAFVGITRELTGKYLFSGSR
jgi:hypothetical protein